MPGLVLKIQPQFPAQVTGVAPIVITKTGLSYQISLSALGTTVAVAQIKAQLVTIGSFDTILATIPGSPSDPVNAIWTGGGATQATGPLLTSINTTLGYVTQPQKDAFVAACLLKPF